MAARSRQLQIRVTSAQKVVLKRLARRAGQDVSSYVLARALPAARLQFDQILRALRREEQTRFVLAELSDLLSGLPRAEFREIVADVTVEELSPFLQNYVAAMIEQAAHQKGEAPPPWTGDVSALEEPYFVAPFSRLRPHLLRSSPVPFKRRNLFVDSVVGDRV